MVTAHSSNRPLKYAIAPGRSWLTVTNVESSVLSDHSSEACTGIMDLRAFTLRMLMQVDALVSFGGYNGRYHRAVHLFKPGALGN